MDKWDTESVDIVTRLGNQVVNLIYEAGYTGRDNDITKPDPESDRQAKERWCVAKYVAKAFVRTPQIDQELMKVSIDTVSRLKSHLAST